MEHLCVLPKCVRTLAHILTMSMCCFCAHIHLPGHEHIPSLHTAKVNVETIQTCFAWLFTFRTFFKRFIVGCMYVKAALVVYHFPSFTEHPVMPFFSVLPIPTFAHNLHLETKMGQNGAYTNGCGTSHTLSPPRMLCFKAYPYQLPCASFSS